MAVHGGARDAQPLDLRYRDGVEYDVNRVPTTDELVHLYDAVGWSTYTKDRDGLATAVRNSTFVVTASADGRLVGLARVLSDDVSVVYVQDVLVHPQYQRNGIGRELLERCLDRFSHVRQRMLLTDDEDHQHRLYTSLGFHDVARLQGAGLHAFVDILGADLSSSEPPEQ